MIKKHLITKEHNQDIIYLYLDNKYEISTNLYITKNNNTLMFTLPRKSDLKRFNLRKKLKGLTVIELPRL